MVKEIHPAGAPEMPAVRAVLLVISYARPVRVSVWPLPPVAPHDELTARQRQVLELVAGGLTDAAIARRLGCSRRTVTKHLEHAYRALGVSCRAAAIATWFGGR
jgi:DNA-binding NarL/FixJ family response regulator